MHIGIVALLFISSLVSVFSIKIRVYLIITPYENGFYVGDVIPNGNNTPAVLPNGVGKMISRTSNGAVYIGHWVNGKRNGTGKMRWHIGSILYYYTGEFKNNFRHGRGFSRIIHYEKYETYLGDFIFNKKSGDGVNTFTEFGLESKYSGKFQNDLPHGTGVLSQFYLYLHYHGTWVNGRKDGQFVVLSDHIFNTWRHECSYSNDLLQGEGKMIYANGTEEIQFWDKGRRHGEQKITHPDGLIETQEWNHGLRHGKQEITYIDGRMETQMWKNDGRNGMLIKKDLDGNEEHYGWRNGKIDPDRPLKRSRVNPE